MSTPAETQAPVAVARSDRRRIGLLVTSNLLGGIGVASGFAVGALLVEQLGATSLAGAGAGLSVLGAAITSVPLAALAVRRGRRWSLSTGYAVAFLGACLVVSAATLRSLPLLLLGLLLFGAAQATNLQARYAAVDGVPTAARGRTMSTVIWATTLGSVAGPNLTDLGERIGARVGVPGLGGPYLFSCAAFLAAALVTLAYRARTPVEARTDTVAVPPVGSLAALRWAGADPVARFAVALVATAHATMVMVMVMTPLHMQHDGMSLRLVGLVISLHIVGMYAFSPVFGWLVDRWGTVPTAALGLVLLASAVTLGFLSAATGGSRPVTAVALLLLGTGWSAATIAGASLVSAIAPDGVRVPLQGATDALMSYAGAGAAVIAGPILAAGDFRAVNVTGALLLIPALLLLRPADRSVALHRNAPTGHLPP